MEGQLVYLVIAGRQECIDLVIFPHLYQDVFGPVFLYVKALQDIQLVALAKAASFVQYADIPP